MILSRHICQQSLAGNTPPEDMKLLSNRLYVLSGQPVIIRMGANQLFAEILSLEHAIVIMKQRDDSYLIAFLWCLFYYCMQPCYII